MKRILWVHASILGLFTTCAATAGTPDLYKSTAMPNEDSWFIGVGGGAGWSHFDNNTTSIPNGAPSPWQNDSLTINSPSATALAQLNVGYRWHQEKQFLPYYQLYLQFRNYTSANVTGNVEQYSLPDMVNYSYSIGYSAQLYTLNGKFNLAEFHRLSPYVAVGGGFIVTHLGSYSESAYPPVTARLNPGYQGGTNTSLAFTAGVGVDFALTENTWLTLGYDHVFQGYAKSNYGTGSWSNTQLKLGNIKTDAVFLNLTAKFPDAFKYS